MPSRFRILRWSVTTLALVVVGGQVWLSAALAPVERELQRRCAALVGGQVQWRRLHVTPWGDVVLRDAQVVPPGPGLPRVMIRRLALHYGWPALVSRRWTHVQRIAATDASLEMPGSGTLLTQGRLVADWQAGRILVRRSSARCFGGVVRAHGILTGVTTADPTWQLNIRWTAPRLSGHLEVGDTVKHPSVVGQVEPSDASPIPMAGHATISRDRLEVSDLQIGTFQAVGAVVDWSTHQWSATLAGPAGGVVTVRGDSMDWQHPRCTVVVEEARLGPATCSTTAHLDATWTTDPRVGRVLEGTVTTSGTTINRQPASDLVGSWRVSGQTVWAQAVTLDEQVGFSGSLGIRAPHPLAATVGFRGVDVERLAAAIEPGKPPLAAGVIRGFVELTGPAAAPRLRGCLAGRRGKIGKTPFTTATVTFDGQGSVVRFLDSPIQQPNQLIMMTGFLDLARLGTATVFEHVQMTPSRAAPAPRPTAIVEASSEEVAHQTSF